MAQWHGQGQAHAASPDLKIVVTLLCVNDRFVTSPRKWWVNIFLKFKFTTVPNNCLLVDWTQHRNLKGIILCFKLNLGQRKDGFMSALAVGFTLFLEIFHKQPCSSSSFLLFFIIECCTFFVFYYSLIMTASHVCLLCQLLPFLLPSSRILVRVVTGAQWILVEWLNISFPHDSRLTLFPSVFTYCMISSRAFPFSEFWACADSL